ncbi:MAG: class I SAM-dependent methyltransferase [Isosphaeraceae bacterium]
MTSAALGRLESGNRPGRRNVKSLPGLAAQTGASNYDLGEAVWLKLIEDLADERPTIALLCKTAVARAVLDEVQRRGLKVATASLHEIDAARWFGASVRACFFRMTLGAGATTIRVPVFARLEDVSPREVMEFHRGRLIADAKALRPFAFALGASPLCWRQGIKHDAAPVMELRGEPCEGPLRNQHGEEVDVEPEHVYPLLKGADLRRPSTERPRRAVIVTQHRLGEPTEDLATRAPRLWAYLQRHAGFFASRKSSIHRGHPPFSLFGVGPYTFAPWKVAVAGLHCPALFRAVGPVGGRPVLVDDTCYLLPCDSAAEAAVLAALCNHRACLGLVAALSFPGSKRHVTKGLLQRLDLSAILKRADRTELIDRSSSILAELTGPAIEPITAIADEIDRLKQRFSQAAAAQGRTP